VPDEVLGGVVENGRKRFTVKIGAKSASVTEIPALPFAYFDPLAERYVTVWSDPIPLEVSASEQVSVSQFAGTDESSGNGSRTTRLTEAAGGIRANFADMDEVLADQAFDPGWGSAVLLLASPLLFAATLVWQRHHDRVTHDHSYVRRRRARATALEALAKAKRGNDGDGTASSLVGVLTRYIGDRCNAAVGLTPTEAVEHLRGRGLAPGRLQSVAAVLERCEAREYAGRNSQIAEELLADVRRCIEDLERERL